MGVAIVGLGERCRLDEMTGEPHVFLAARCGEFFRPRAKPRDTARKLRHLGGKNRIRCGLQPRRITVIPAAIEPPDVMNDEFRLIIDGLHIRLVHEMRGQFHAVNEVIKARPLIHHLKRAGDKEFKRRCNRVEHGRDALLTYDGQAVRGQQKLRLFRCHFAQRPRPFKREALHLLRIARIGENPCDEIARTNGLVLRHPGPEMVIRLANGVT